MDSFTHLAVGACVGHAVAGPRLGRRALAFGALAATIPDLDTVLQAGAGAWAWAEWQHHRGFTHSLFFGVLAGPALGWIAWSYHNRQRPFEPGGGHDALGAWITLFVACLLTHPLLDVFTIYGTQLLAPLSDARFAVAGIGIIDPFYTLAPLLAALLAFAQPARLRSRIAVFAALFVSSGYLLYGVVQNRQVEAQARGQLAREGAAPVEVRVYTTIFQPWLRRIVVDEAAGARVAFASPLQKGAIAWTCFARAADPAIEALRATPEGRLLDWFASGEIWPLVAPASDGSRVVRLTDRRYGAPGPTAQGWWGIEARVGADGRILDAPRRVDLPRGPLGPLIGELVAASLGTPTALFPQAIDAAQAADACARTRIP
ncbi:MAG: metal-dependent hydrolase [Proteobacteria bacterium]|nr:metal-dependent hydrolase [Pseudomonadota bacterium]